VRKGLQMRLEAEPDLSVVGEASDGEVAVELARVLCPDIVLMDVEMPHMDGLRRQRPYTRFARILLSSSEHSRRRAHARGRGARRRGAFCPQVSAADTLLAAIRHCTE